MNADFSKAYGFASGFSYRREPFGGILYHYEGTKPDPRVTFVDNAFLIDILDLVGEAPLEKVVAEVSTHFRLDVKEEAAVREFLNELIARGAMAERSTLCGVCGVPNP